VAGVNVTTRPTATGFFPTQYKMNTSMVRKEDVDLFRLFFDGRMTIAQSDQMVTYMTDGGFIDGQTKMVTVEMITFSPSASKFTMMRFDFNWEVRFLLGCSCLHLIFLCPKVLMY
jgi:hypothetical protein